MTFRLLLSIPSSRLFFLLLTYRTISLFRHLLRNCLVFLAKTAGFATLLWAIIQTRSCSILLHLPQPQGAASLPGHPEVGFPSGLLTDATFSLFDLPSFTLSYSVLSSSKQDQMRSNNKDRKISCFLLTVLPHQKWQFSPVKWGVFTRHGDLCESHAECSSG